ncbi:MAG TPA: type II toxin-antitoxin system VapC family toxin [Candidatus Methylacidiphilales bacterium]|jgi:tRNA(fMet)-specific endonuclease VapC|nr:type II toxin-antitoxin system VapC family toxin [Candidatus Methylacidiphilales bacterium]
MPGIGDVLLDTSVAVAHLRGNPSVALKLAQADALFLPLVALGELLCGIRKSVRTQQNLAILQNWMRSTTLISLTEATADRHATIKVQLAQAGTPIPENDVWIAAHAMEHGLSLATRDEHFLRIAGLVVLDWR